MKFKPFIKFIITTIICYALLAFNVFHIGEMVVPDSIDYTEMNIPELSGDSEKIEANIDTGHFAADYTNNLNNLCKRIGICDKIQFNGEFSSNEKYSYTKNFNQIVEFIDNNSDQNTPIKKVISAIEINKDNGDRRGYATRDSIIFNVGSVTSPKEFTELSTHEMGHITDLGYIQGTTSKKDKNFTEFNKVVFALDDISLLFYKLSRNNETIRKAEAKKKDFCSGYGMSDPFEDFAECFNLYTNHNSFFRQAAKANGVLKNKYNFIAEIFSGKYISTSTGDLAFIENNDIRRPRDTTKLTNN